MEAKRPKEGKTRAVVIILALTCTATIACSVFTYRRQVSEAICLFRLRHERDYLVKALGAPPAGPQEAALRRFLVGREGKEVFFRRFYDEVVKKYPWLPRNFKDGLHGRIQFNPQTPDNIEWMLRIPGNACWNNQPATRRLLAMRPFLDLLRYEEFAIAELPGWRFVLCGKNPPDLGSQVDLGLDACTAVGPRSEHGPAIEAWLRAHADDRHR